VEKVHSLHNFVEGSDADRVAHRLKGDVLKGLIKNESGSVPV
jgi:hypothetical protein